MKTIIVILLLLLSTANAVAPNFTVADWMHIEGGDKIAQWGCESQKWDWWQVWIAVGIAGVAKEWIDVMYAGNHKAFDKNDIALAYVGMIKYYGPKWRIEF